MIVDEIKNNLPKTSISIFEDIVYGKVLGASNHIKMIANMFIDISKNNEDEESKRKIKEVSDFFKETRGKSSYAIITALNLIEEKINNSLKLNYVEQVKEGVEEYFIDSDNNVKKVIEYSKRVLEKVNCIMIFDYSSSVEKAVVSASNVLDVYIPESRSINGGFPFVDKIVHAGHHVHFIADAAMLTVLKNIDLVLIGAETFYPDGTAFNTVGSDILAVLCKNFNIPYYVITPLLKVDLRTIYGQYKEVIANDLKDTLAANWDIELANKVDFKGIELVGVEPKFITAFITEKGIISPTNLFQFVYKE